MNTLRKKFESVPTPNHKHHQQQARHCHFNQIRVKARHLFPSDQTHFSRFCIFFLFILVSLSQTALKAEKLHPRIEQLSTSENPFALQLLWKSSKDTTAYYLIESTDDLSQAFTPFNLVANTNEANEQAFIIDEPKLSERKFYRIKKYSAHDRYLSLDSDSDGLSNKHEVSLKANPYLIDTDQDGYHDITEYTLNSNLIDTQSVPSGFFTDLKISLGDLNLDDDIWQLKILNSRIGIKSLANHNPRAYATTHVQLKEGERLSMSIKRLTSYEKFTDEYYVSLSGSGQTYPNVIILSSSGTQRKSNTSIAWSKWLNWTNDNTTPPDPSDSWSFYAPKRTLSVSDPSEKAGTRESTNKIVVVKTDNTKPTVRLEVEDPCTRTPSGYPRWSNRGLANYHGQRSAQLSTGWDTTIVAYLSPEIKTRPIRIKVVDENKFEANWDFDSEHFQSLQKAINTVLAKIGDTELSLSGSIAAEFKRVDYYNDPSRYGHAAQLTGSLSASFPDIAIESPDVYVYPGVYLVFGAGFEGTQITLSASTDYDQSRATPGQVSGTLAGQSSGFVSGATGVGKAEFISIEATITGSSTFKTSGTLSLKDKKILLSGNVGVGDIEAKGDISLILPNEITIRLFKVKHLFKINSNANINKPIYTFK